MHPIIGGTNQVVVFVQKLDAVRAALFEGDVKAVVAGQFAIEIALVFQTHHAVAHRLLFAIATGQIVGKAHVFTRLPKLFGGAHMVEIGAALHQHFARHAHAVSGLVARQQREHIAAGLSGCGQF